MIQKYLILILLGLATSASAYEVSYGVRRNEEPWVKVAKTEPLNNQTTTEENPVVDEGSREVNLGPAQQYYLAPDGSLMVWDGTKKEFRKNN